MAGDRYSVRLVGTLSITTTVVCRWNCIDSVSDINNVFEIEHAVSTGQLAQSHSHFSYMYKNLLDAEDGDSALTTILTMSSKMRLRMKGG